MTSDELQDNLHISLPTDDNRFRPYAGSRHIVTKSRYITSNDPRGYIPVYEYPLKGQWIMMDADDGYILWTGIWKALGNSKADIIKMIDSQPELAGQIRRVRGGYLKIQGTWMPYEVALRLARRVAYDIRDDLVPLFGPTFPTTCLMPGQDGYGHVVPAGTGRRRARRATQNQHSFVTTTDGSSGQDDGWTVYSSPVGRAFGSRDVRSVPYSSTYGRPSTSYVESHPNGLQNRSPAHFANGGQGRYADTREHNRGSRFSPYLSPPSSTYTGSYRADDFSPIDTPRQPYVYAADTHRQAANSNRIPIVPVHVPESSSNNGQSSFSLPPISVLASVPAGSLNDPRAVLQRLRCGDDSGADQFQSPSMDQLRRRRRSISQPPVVPGDRNSNFINTSLVHGSLYTPTAFNNCKRSTFSLSSPSNSCASSVNDRISTDDRSSSEPMTPPPNFVAEPASGLAVLLSSFPARSKDSEPRFVCGSRVAPYEDGSLSSAGSDWSRVQPMAVQTRHVPFQKYTRGLEPPSGT